MTIAFTVVPLGLVFCLGSVTGFSATIFGVTPTRRTATSGSFFATTQSSQSSAPALDEVTRLREEAARIRKEAAELDASLTKRKIESLEEKIEHSKDEDEIQGFRKQLQQLRMKSGSRDGDTQEKTSENVSLETTVVDKTEKSATESIKSTDEQIAKKLIATFEPVEDESNSGTSLPAFTITEDDIAKAAEKKQAEKDDSSLPSPVAGFDPEDLELYVPICWEIEERAGFLNLTEKMEVFRTEPRLQDHFTQKITAMIVQPMQDIQQLEELRSSYLYSSSSMEKKELKRQIEKLEKHLESEEAGEDGPIEYMESLYRELPPLTDMEERIKAISELPPTLQAVYKQRNKLPPDADLELAIYLDYYDMQLQLLDQIPFVHPITAEMREQVTKAVESLPLAVKRHILTQDFGETIGSNDDINVEDLVDRLCSEDRKSDGDDDSPWAQFHQGGFSVTVEKPEYNDIEFVDRSRYVSELYPSLARLEIVSPAEEMVDKFMKECINRKMFMVSSKPERVLGGYYIRGSNMISGDEEVGGIELSTKLDEKLADSPLNDKLDFFYIADPAPVSDENFEMGYTNSDPVIFVTAKEPSVLYESSDFLTKLSVTSLGALSLFLFALATCELQPLLAEKIEVTLQNETPDISFLTSTFLQSISSILAIQFAHELGHRVIAWKDKVRRLLPGTKC